MNEYVTYASPVKALGYSVVYHIAVLDPMLSDGALRTLLVYLMHAQQDDTCWPSRKLVAALRNKDETTISRHNSELEELGYIRRVQRPDGTTITYILDYEQNPRLVELASQILDRRCKNATTPVAKMQPPPLQKCNAEELTNEEVTNEEYLPCDLTINEEPQEPIGSGNDEVVVHDLDELWFQMSEMGHRKQDLTAQCTRCQARHTQDVHICPDCGAHVVWLHSSVWKKRYGEPHEYMRLLRGEELKPVTPLQILACQVFGNGQKFANITQKRVFQALERKYPQEYLKDLLDWAKGKGFARFESAARNPDNFMRWSKQNAETVRHTQQRPMELWQCVEVV